MARGIVSGWRIESEKDAGAEGRTLRLDLDQAKEGQAVLLDRKLQTGRVGQTSGQSHAGVVGGGQRCIPI